MSEESDGSSVDAIVDDLARGEGTSFVRLSDPDAVARALADAIGGELVEGTDDFVTAVDARRKALKARTDALAALELHGRLHEGSADELHPVIDLEGLRTLVGRIETATDLVAASRTVLQERVSESSTLAVHPDSIRAAAADVVAAREAVERLGTQLARAEEAAREAHEADLASIVDDRPPAGRFDEDERRTLVRAVVVIVVSFAVAAFALVSGAGAVVFLLPVVALCWGGYYVYVNRDSAEARDLASDNLAAVSALTDRVYAGAGALVDVPEEVITLRDDLAKALDRRGYAESVWVGLVGADTPVDDLESLLERHDPNFRIAGEDLARTPTVRAAEAHVRRLRAQWRLAFDALDREVPPIRDARAAVDGLESEGVDVITVPTYVRRSEERAEDQERLAELTRGRSIEDLREAATQPLAPIVLVDGTGSMTGSELAARTAAIPGELRIVVVAPEVDDDDRTDDAD